MAEDVRSTLQKLPPSEFDKMRQDIVNVDLLPASWRTRAIGGITEQYVNRSRFYGQQGKLPEDVQREEQHRMLPWLLVLLLAALLLLVALHRQGISDCSSPDVVFGGCETYQ